MSDTPKKKRSKWRNPRLLVILTHRYLGYLFAGTTVVYAISGIAVNHIEDWNPNFSIARQSTQIQAFEDLDNIQTSEATALFQAFKVEKPFNPSNVFYPDETTIEMLISSNEKILVNTQTWKAEHEVVSRRPVLHLFNFLHLNSAKGFWTWYADIYAICLLLIAVSGLLMKKGKKGLWGEAGIWAAAGMILPIVLTLLYYK